jgi:hypothetical protein
MRVPCQIQQAPGGVPGQVEIVECPFALRCLCLVLDTLKSLEEEEEASAAAARAAAEEKEEEEEEEEEKGGGVGGHMGCGTMGSEWGMSMAAHQSPCIICLWRGGGGRKRQTA